MSTLSLLAQYRDSLKGATHLETTQLQLINLDLLKARYQERWPKVRSRIFDTCEQFIQKRVGPDDVVLRANNGFVVLPGRSRAESAEAFTARIELELKAFFLGTDYLKELGVETDTVQIAVAELFGALQSPQLDKAASAHEDAAASAGNNAAPLNFSRFTLRFEPFLAVASGYVAMHRAQPVGRMDETGPLVRGYLLCPASGGHALRMEFDREVIVQAAEHWEAATGRYAAGVLAVPVHFETLSAVKYRLPYMASFNALGDRTRTGLILNITGLPMDAPSGIITEICRIAGTLTRRVMVQIDPRSVRVDRFDDAQVSIFSMPSPPVAALQCQNGQIVTLAGRLARGGRMLAIEGCDRPGQFAASLPLRPNYVTGMAIGPDVEDVPAPYRLNPAGNPTKPVLERLA
ncbi:hypothetical protein X907_2798 [Glycocaulis alkaliphilus]|uniref:Uncharacterized protein n=1 Tax=Glycocaulis alkaliphilus TaxID=1434191 RepID=A0A3T0EDD5_9PROT|nr:hypothetical protein [Glycocaulis alkaliphilus]AZU05307.1 hypothetical protein X907_2798 [Glycocaulis alkaliphilus]GGB81701.1 hypothetical protein GCM10007417_22050 [Glycocaulis alkaliphilus]